MLTSDLRLEATGFIVVVIVFVSPLTDYHRCQKALDAKGVDTAPCEWYKRVYKSLCLMSWVNTSLTAFYKEQNNFYKILNKLNVVDF